MKLTLLISLALSLLLPSQAPGLERFDIITTSEMKQMLDDRANGKIDFLLVNGLDRMIYNHSAIPGSINIPLASFEQQKEKLGEDMNQLIVPY